MDEFLLLDCKISQATPTGIRSVDVVNIMAEGIFSPSGLRRESLQRGLNIIVSANGQKRKVFVK